MPFIANKMSLESQGNHSYDMGIQMMSAAGGTMCGIFLTCIACFAIDRSFHKCVVVSFFMCFLSLFGFFASHNDIIDPSTGVRGPRHEKLGIYDRSSDLNQGWRWAISWAMVGVFFLVHIPFQKKGSHVKMPIDMRDMKADPYDSDTDLS